MLTLFISDLHLDDERPETIDLLLDFLSHEAAKADALYILGDLFEYWLGDDVGSRCATQVTEALSSLAVKGLSCYFMHGNRDFLLGDAYARRAGLTLLPEEHVVDLYGDQVLLMHGDSLCTQDIPYQQFRTRVRNPAWQDDFLSKPPGERMKVAMEAREASARHKSGVEMSIMDVSPTEVISAFERHDVHRMIHGHTHRPAIHDLDLNGRPAQRIVLGDWYVKSSVLRVAPGQYDLVSLDSK